MLVDVVFLKQGSHDPLRFNAFMFAWREGLGQIKTGLWNHAALELNRLALTGDFTPVDIFLCLKTQRFTDLLNRDFISKLVKYACNHSWGGSVYVVVDASQEPLLDLIDLRDHLDSLCNWYRDIHESGATDIIQAKFNTLNTVEVWNDAASLNSLLSGADRSRARHEALSPEGDWNGLLRKESGMLKSLLSEFGIYTDCDVPLARRGNWVVVMEDISLKKQERMLYKALTVRPDKCLVAIGDSMKMSLLNDINQLRQSGDLRIAWYRGSFELRYLFHLLSADKQMFAAHEMGRVETIWSGDKLVFHQPKDAKPPSMLVTSSFHPSNVPMNEHQSLQAAMEVGQSVIGKPAHTKYIVSPATDCANLPEAVKNLPLNLTAWLHVGHGDRELGMQESSGEFRSAQRWLDCFLGHGNRGGSLSLAIFSACQTEEIARKFAQAGAGVAIGFEKSVPSAACRLLTSRIIRAALRSVGDPKAILQAFHNGCAELQSHGHDGLGPVAFCSKR